MAQLPDGQEPRSAMGPRSFALDSLLDIQRASGRNACDQTNLHVGRPQGVLPRHGSNPAAKRITVSMIIKSEPLSSPVA